LITEFSKRNVEACSALEPTLFKERPEIHRKCERKRNGAKKG